MSGGWDCLRVVAHGEGQRGWAKGQASMGRLVAKRAPECPLFLGSCQVSNFFACTKVLHKRDKSDLECATGRRKLWLTSEQQIGFGASGVWEATGDRELVGCPRVAPGLPCSCSGEEKGQKD